MVNSSKTYLYEQLKESLRAKIESQQYKAGDKIPPEAELCAQYGVSRITVRKAIADLVEEQLLEKRQGKGTYVMQNMQFTQHLYYGGRGFSGNCRENGTIPSTKILQISLQEAGPEDIEAFGIPEGSHVIYIRRICYSNGIPLMLENNYFPEKYRSLMALDLQDASIYNILKRDYGIEAMGTNTTIQIVKTTEEEARHLNIKPNTAVLQLTERNCEMESGAPVHRTRQLITGEYYIYEIKTTDLHNTRFHGSGNMDTGEN